MTSSLNLWLIPTLPLAGAAINGFLGKRSSRTAVSTIGLFFSGAAFAWALRWSCACRRWRFPTTNMLAHWIRSGSFTVDFAFYLDQLSLVMLLVVTGVGFLIHIYSVGYMWDDPSYYRFFTYLNLFMFFMLTLVLANNYLMMFIGWEGVGLASYLLIGFWFTKDSAASAGKKAFIVNRIGDFGFLIALFLIIQHFGSLELHRGICASSAAGRRNGGCRISDRNRNSADGRRVREVGADPALCMAARRYGRPDAGFRADPRRDHGDGRRLHGIAFARDLRARADGADRSRHHWHADGAVRGDDRHHAN